MKQTSETSYIFTIGRRTSGKFTRFYEKGKKEGDKLSPWLRAEVEFKIISSVPSFGLNGDNGFSQARAY